MVSGSVRFSVDHYNFVKDFIDIHFYVTSPEYSGSDCSDMEHEGKSGREIGMEKHLPNYKEIRRLK